jgi:uncharacterized protein YqgC (DUF456 family)
LSRIAVHKEISTFGLFIFPNLPVSIMILDILLVVLGICFIIGGLLGCILPVMPGPPLSYIALLLLQATKFADYSTKFLLITASVMIVVTVLDYLLPVWGTRKWGGSRAGAIGSILGLLVGLFLSPVGIIVGPFVGAVLGELIAGHDTGDALRSGFGSFIGFLLGTGMKLAVSVTFTYYYAKELIV